MTLHAAPDTLDFAALSKAWVEFCETSGIPLNYQGNSTAEAHAGVERAQQLLREHIIATNDYRLFPLLHILGNASLRMEQVLDPIGYAETTSMIEAALADAELHDGPLRHDAATAARLATSVLRRD